MKKPIVSVVMGSDSDLEVMTGAVAVLDEFDLPYEVRVLSAHRSPEETARYAKGIKGRGIKVVIAAAGKAAHLAGVVAAHTAVPVIGVPIKTSLSGGLDSLLSMVQMPSGVPVATVAVNGAANAAILATQILALADSAVAQKLKKYRNKLKETSLAKDRKLQKLGTQSYLDSKNSTAREKSVQNELTNVVDSIELQGFGKKHSGKVRDFYIKDDKRYLITTDRLSAFDVILGLIPYKGAVLTQLSKFWFDKTRHIVPNHMIEVPDPNVLVAHELEPIPVEMIIRGYISGVTKTSIWYSYERGERTIYGLTFPDGLQKNQKLPQPVITPTTHPLAGSGGHDERLTREEIIEQGIVDKKLYKQMEKVSLQLFEFGSRLCKRNGLMLVDTKYEFGLYKGKLMVMDEIHTPDSSRFWIAKTYKDRLRKGLEPENFDKEFLRLHYANKLNYRGDGKPPKMPVDLALAVSKRYIKVYETITGKKFKKFDYPIQDRIAQALAEK